MNKSEKRQGIIASVQTPLGFFTLIVLVCEVILGSLAFRAKDTDLTILLGGMLLVLVLLVVSVSIIEFRRNQRSSDTTDGHSDSKKYDVFLSSVLAGFQDDAKLQEEKQLALAVVRCLEEDCKYEVYYAGRDVSSTKDFDASHISARADIDALRQSRYFLLIYPQRIISSVIFEAGMALEKCEASIYFVRDHQDLPYLMRRLTEAVGNVKAYKYQSADDITKVIKLHRKSLFADVAMKAV